MAPGAGKYDTPVDPENANSTYGLICRQVPKGADVLDLGCAGGGLARALETARGCRVLACDIDPEAVATARARGLEAVVADLSRQTPASIAPGRQFDVVVLADVLEHLVEPRILLRAVADVLCPGGKVLVSFPNVSHADVALMVAQDEWRYQPAGILDRTHVRFFTLGTFRDLAFDCGYDVATVERVTLPLLGTEVLEYGKANSIVEQDLEAIRAAVTRANPNATVYQYVLELLRSAVLVEDADSAQESFGAAATTPRLAGSAAPQLDVIVRTMEGRLSLVKDALYALAAQTHPSVRAIVTVHGPSRGYLKAVQDLVARLQGLLEVEVVPVPRKSGLRGEPLNWGLDQLEGEFFAFCDDDDVLYPSFAERLIGHLQEHPEIAVAYGIGQVVHGEIATDGFRSVSHGMKYGDPFDRARLFVENYIPINTYVARTADQRRDGIRFDESLPVYEDWVFLRELAARHQFSFVDAVVSEYRLWGKHSNAVPASQEALWGETRAAVLRSYGSQPVRTRARELTELVERSQELNRRVENLQEQLGEERALTGRILSSRSWQLTRLLRRVLGSDLPERPGPSA
jgi:methionine biosynthesis protein MetW